MKRAWFVMLMVFFCLPPEGHAASFDAAFGKILPVCEQFYLPNSMARKPGFDIDAHMNELAKRLDELSATFNTPAGKSYLRAKAGTEHDELALTCISRIRHSIGDGVPQAPSNAPHKPSAHATRSPDEVVRELTVSAANKISIGNTPDQIVAFLKGLGFHYSSYDRNARSLTGLALYDKTGNLTDPDHYDFNVAILFTFDDHDHLKDFNIETQKLTSPPIPSDQSEDQTDSDSQSDDYEPQYVSQTFASPDQSCHLVYEGVPDHGYGTMYEMHGGKRHTILKDYFRLGPDVRWVTNSIAELFFSEGSPAYHSYFFDCSAHRISQSYFQRIAFNPATRIVATLDTDAIVFYRLFDKKELYRAAPPGLDMMDYLDCDSDASFESPAILHLKIARKECGRGKDLDVKITVPTDRKSALH